MIQRGNPGCPEEDYPAIVGMCANGLTVEEQIAEDTCEKHKQFCCPVCFNTGTVD